MQTFKSGFIAIVGVPNAGKSTLLNSILGEKVSIVSRRPQTTRNVVRGVKNVKGAQLIFLDTPGFHAAKGGLNEFMVREALNALKGVDAAVLVVDGAKAVKGAPREDESESAIIENLGRFRIKTVLAVNKVDAAAKQALLPVIDFYARGKFNFSEIIPISALKGDGVEALVTAAAGLLPEGPVYFPDDIATDQPERFIAAEFVREKIFELTREEVPYSTAVVVEEFKENKAKKLISIKAAINVERESQKGIVIGKGGAMLKRIGTGARIEMERLLGAKVFLELFVRVEKEWTRSARAMKEFGYE